MTQSAHPQTLILPGLAGSPEGHWQYLWAEERQNARYVEQENWDFPDLARWIATLDQALEESDGVYLVAHSLGCVLAAHVAALPSARKIRGALLVAPCDLEATGRIHPGLISFGVMPESPLPFPSVLVASRDDPYMSYDRAGYFADRWGADLHDLGYAGHINLSSGYGRFHRGYRLFDALVERTGRPLFTPRGAGFATPPQPEREHPLASS